MASVERPTFTQAIPPHARRVTEGGTPYALWTDRKGQAVRAVVLPSGKCRRTVPRKWVGVYRDERGTKRKTKPFGDRSVALEAALKMERHAAAVREGRASSHAPADGRAHLIDHVADYITFRREKGAASEQAAWVAASLRALIARHGLTTPAAVDGPALARALERERLSGDPRGRKRGGRPLSTRTLNKRVAELRGFGRWLVRTGRAAANPFETLAGGNAELDRRRVRRTIPHGQFAALLAATGGSADEFRGLSGADRRALYLVAAYTGLRAGALARLTPEAFTWAAGVPAAVFSGARLQKNKKPHGVPLAPAVAGELAAWLRGRPLGVPLWPGGLAWAGDAATMLRRDLAAASIPYADAAGQVFDFHALRGQFGFLLASSGVPLVVAQKLLDHSTPALTANVYSRFGGEGMAAEVAKLPGLGSLGAPLGSEGGGTAGKGPPKGGEQGQG